MCLFDFGSFLGRFLFAWVLLLASFRFFKIHGFKTKPPLVNLNIIYINIYYIYIMFSLQYP